MANRASELSQMYFDKANTTLHHLRLHPCQPESGMGGCVLYPHVQLAKPNGRDAPYSAWLSASATAERIAPWWMGFSTLLVPLARADRPVLHHRSYLVRGDTPDFTSGTNSREIRSWQLRNALLPILTVLKRSAKLTHLSSDDWLEYRRCGKGAFPVRQ